MTYDVWLNDPETGRDRFIVSGVSYRAAEALITNLSEIFPNHLVWKEEE